MTELKFARKGPETADAAVVFLHGYGADGADLLGLADPLSPHLPGTAFYAPDAPERSVNNPFGYQWFPIHGWMARPRRRRRNRWHVRSRR